jgi:TrbC/VIRB2 pilin
MYQTEVTTQHNQNNWTRYAGLFLFIALCMLVAIEPAFATGTGTGTGAGGAGAAQTRITNVATGWQNIVQGVGVAVLVIAWSYVGYMIAFAGKTMKDMFPTMVGTSIAGLAPVLVGWLFS